MWMNSDHLLGSVVMKDCKFRTLLMLLNLSTSSPKKQQQKFDLTNAWHSDIKTYSSSYFELSKCQCVIYSWHGRKSFCYWRCTLTEYRWERKCNSIWKRNSFGVAKKVMCYQKGVVGSGFLRKILSPQPIRNTVKSQTWSWLIMIVTTECQDP